MIDAIQNALKLRRTIEITVPISLAIAQQNIREGLYDDIVLSSKFKVRRRYWGSADLNQVRFFGPKARKQFCFRTQGKLTGNQDETKLVATMRLCTFDFYQLLFAALVFSIILAIGMQEAAIFPLLAFFLFLYGMTQWHFEVYQRDIKCILTCLLKTEPLYLP